MPSGVYPRKPKPKNPLKWGIGKKIVSLKIEDYNMSARVELDDGSTLVFKPYEDSMMFNDRWPAVRVYVEEGTPA